MTTTSSHVLTAASPSHLKPATAADNGGFQVTKRLRKELMTLMMTPTPGISAFPESDSNLFRWLGTMTGPDGTAYAGLTYRLSLSFPADYPYSAPKIKFETPCFHPNVHLEGGDICLDILQDKWSAVYSVHTILVSLQSLLGDPNNASPLNVDAAQIWDDQEEFKKKVLATYRPL
ncbi:hypothetical protein CI109_102355 [Kwoniella shandongensis]|uniref:UBC core domain-containing protein n=1 Tax=Kwoniella shandongensis TaxID=1734106 RepID=A0A5M6BZX0_9TREE|nr:uncharacterized protein CI109_003327 [Kwoniella shandongensis]KAA5528427.1 hypothetical protein CI109_003327 [Kwoniella shandongensis]